VAVLVTGGASFPIGDDELRVRGIANPVAIALAAAGVRRLIAASRAARAAPPVLRLGGALRQRARGWATLRADALVVALLAIAFLDRGLLQPLRVDGDGVGYYAYVRSWLIDRDIDFTNEYRDFDPRRQWLEKKTAIGRVENPFSIGPAVLWIPFFGIGWA